MAPTSLHDDVFLTPKNFTSERPIAPLPTMIRWWAALRGPEVLRWQQRYRVGWDATEGRNGGAERMVWETLLELERFYHRVSEHDPRATVKGSKNNVYLKPFVQWPDEKQVATSLLCFFPFVLSLVASHHIACRTAPAQTSPLKK